MELEDKRQLTISAVVLIFAAMTIPVLLELIEPRQDCYASIPDCQNDWGADDCKPYSGPAIPDNKCHFVGRSYRGFRSGSGGYIGRSSSIGTVSRGGFGKTGMSFGGHGFS